MGFAKLEDTLKSKKLATAPFSGSVEASMIIEHAQNILDGIFSGDTINNAKALFVKNRTLTVTCTGSIVAQEVKLRQSEIIDKINDKLGKKEVDRIRYLT